MPRRSAARQELVEAVANGARLLQSAAQGFDDAAAAVLGLNRSDIRVLDLLHLNEPMTAGALARASGLTTGAVTALLDRMERAGYVRRVRDEQDRRRVHVELTDEAHRRADEIWGPLADTGWMTSAYSNAELELLRDFLARARAMQEQHTERVRAMRELSRAWPGTARPRGSSGGRS